MSTVDGSFIAPFPLTPIAFQVHKRANGAFIASVAPSTSVTPIVSNVSPSSGAVLRPEQSISFNVTSPSSTPFRSITILAQYQSRGIYEVIYDGVTFSNNYSGNITSISEGFIFSNILRAGGWLSPPTILPIAIDIYGKENS